MMKKILLITLIFISCNVFASPQIIKWYAIFDKCPPEKQIVSYFSSKFDGIDLNSFLKHFNPDDCISCDTTDALRISLNYVDKFESACPNRKTIHEDDMDYGLSVLKKCPSDKPLITYDGCLPCDIPSEELVQQEADCTMCQNRYYKEKWCILKKCPDTAPIRSKTGGCYACDYEGFFLLVDSKDDCEVCPNRSFEFVDGMKFCSLKECPPDKPHKMLGGCYE